MSNPSDRNDPKRPLHASVISKMLAPKPDGSVNLTELVRVAESNSNNNMRLFKLFADIIRKKDQEISQLESELIVLTKGSCSDVELKNKKYQH